MLWNSFLTRSPLFIPSWGWTRHPLYVNPPPKNATHLNWIPFFVVETQSPVHLFQKTTTNQWWKALGRILELELMPKRIFLHGWGGGGRVTPLFLFTILNFYLKITNLYACTKTLTYEPPSQRYQPSYLPGHQNTRRGLNFT